MSTLVVGRDLLRTCASVGDLLNPTGVVQGGGVQVPYVDGQDCEEGHEPKGDDIRGRHWH